MNCVFGENSHEFCSHNAAVDSRHQAEERLLSGNGNDLAHRARGTASRIFDQRRFQSRQQGGPVEVFANLFFRKK